MSGDLGARALEDREARAFARWAALPVCSIGFLAPVPFLIATYRTKARGYAVAAAFWIVMVIACVVCLAIAGHNNALTDVAGFLVIINAVGASAHTWAIRGAVGRAVALEEDPQLRAAERRVDKRRYALELARSDPKRALGLGVGRPDVEGAFDGGLIDVNHAPPEVLERLPGIDPDRARRIVELRMNGSGFVSAEDLDMVLDLDPGMVAELATQAVFLPRY